MNDKNNLHYWECMLKNYGLLGYSRVLDVGCGNGKALIAFSKACKEVYGIEPDSSFLQIGRENFKKYNVEGIRLLQSFAEDLPFKDESFDLIFCRVVLMYTDKEKVMSEFSRVLKKNGKIFISIDGVGYYLGCIVDGIKSKNFYRAWFGLLTIIRTFLYRKLLRIKGQYTTALTFRDLKRLYQRYGFKILAMDYEVREYNQPVKRFGLPNFFMSVAEKT